MTLEFFWSGVACDYSKNWLDFGGYPAHVTLGLRLQLPTRKFDESLSFGTVRLKGMKLGIGNLEHF